MSRPLAEFEVKKDGDAAQTVGVRIIENKDLDVEGNFVIVCMIGQSRYGKSSFLNCLTSTIMKKNMACFKSMSVKESKACDVTKGMQYYRIDVTTESGRNGGYIIIDVQGIAGTQSEIDPALLMYCYFISDIIIVNCGKTLDTSVLKMLEPISTLRTKIQIAQPNQPSLIFRLMDVDDYDNETAKQCFTAMMTDREDQVHGVRLCLRELFMFDEVPVIYTERPDKADIRLLDSGKIMEFLSRNESFSLACKKVFNRITESQWSTTTNIQTYLREQAAIVNENRSHINASTFDVTSRITQEDIMEWIHGTVFTKDNTPAVKSSVPDELKTPIGISTCHTADYEKVLQRQERINACVAAYNERFHDAPSDIFKQGRDALSGIIMRPLEDALEICRKSSWNEFKACLVSANSLMNTPFDLAVLDDTKHEVSAFSGKISSIFKSFGYKPIVESEIMGVKFHTEQLKKHITERIQASACHTAYKNEIIEQHMEKFTQAIHGQIGSARDEEMKTWSENIAKFKKRYADCCHDPLDLLRRNAYRLDMSFDAIVASIEYTLAAEYNMCFSDQSMLRELRVYMYKLDFSQHAEGVCVPILTRLNEVTKYYKLSMLKKILDFDYETYISRLHTALEQQRDKFKAYREEHLDELIEKLVEEKKIPRIIHYTHIEPYYAQYSDLAHQMLENKLSVHIMPKYPYTSLNTLLVYIDVFKIRSEKEFRRVTSPEVRTLLQQYYTLSNRPSDLVSIKNKPIEDTPAAYKENAATVVLNKMYERWLDDILLGRIQL